MASFVQCIETIARKELVSGDDAVFQPTVSASQAGPWAEPEVNGHLIVGRGLKMRYCQMWCMTYQAACLSD